MVEVEPECPVEATYPEDEVPEEMQSYVTRAANYFEYREKDRQSGKNLATLPGEELLCVKYEREFSRGAIR